MILDERQKLEEAQETIRTLKRNLDEANLQSEALLGASKSSSVNAVDLLESISKLQKENKFLRAELDNRFDKEKHIMQAQLQDALRDKTRLEEGKQEMEDRLSHLQKKLEELSL